MNPSTSVANLFLEPFVKELQNNAELRTAISDWFKRNTMKTEAQRQLDKEPLTEKGWTFIQYTDGGWEIETYQGHTIARRSTWSDRVTESHRVGKLLTAAPQLLEATRRALRIEEAELSELLANGHDKESMNVAACLDNIAVYRDAIIKAEQGPCPYP